MKTEAELALESLKAAMDAYDNNEDAQKEEAEKLSKALNVDKEKILKVLKAAIKKD